MASTYARQPDSLEALKRVLLPNGDQVSPNVAENDPELNMPTPTSMSEIEGNNRLKEMLGLGPSPMIQRQGKDLATQESAISAAHTAAQPDVAAQAAKEQANKLAIAGEPNRVAGQSSIALENVKQKPMMDFLAQQNTGASAGSQPMQFTPHLSESGISFSGEAPPKLNQQEQSMVDSAHGITALGQPLLQKFAAKYPGIDTNPEKYGNVLADTLAPKIGKAAYMFGGMTGNDDIMQDSAAIQAWGMKALMNGRINRQMMDLISAHLPQPGFSAGANYDRLRRLMTDILPAQMQGISEGRGADALTLPQPQNPRSNPDWQPK